MKKGLVKNNKLAFASLILFFAIILTFSFVLAAHVITTDTGGNSYSVDEDIGFVYNLTVNNTDITETANITQVNITLPDTFLFLADSNGTDAGTHTFTNTSTILSWENEGLVMNLTFGYFWFNATASTPGTYNLTVSTTNDTITEMTNISVTINDTTAPSSIEFVSPTESDYANLSQSNIAVNVTAEDNGVIDTIIIRLFNSTSDEINSSDSSTSPLFIDFTGLTDGVYYFNATVNDTYGNSNSTLTRTVTLDTTHPIVNLISPADATSSTTSAYNFTFNVTDDQIIANCSLIFDGAVINVLTSVNNTGGTNGMYNSSLSVATHTWSVNCTDITGNTGNSSTRTLIVSSATSTSTTTSSGGGGYPILRPNDKELSEGYQKVLYSNWKVLFKVNNKSHTFEVKEITETSAKISISSETQEATLSVGEEAKFDLSGDNYYDLSVKLNSIDSTSILYPKANFTIQYMSEEIKEIESVEETPSIDLEDEIGEEESNLRWLWVTILIIVILILSSVGYKKLKN